MKYFCFFATALLLFGSCSPKSGPSAANEPAQAPQTEAELAERVISRVKHIISETDARLSAITPIVDTLAPEAGQSQGNILQLWMEDEKAVKLKLIEPGQTEADNSVSTFYFAGSDLFYAAQPFAHFIFIGGNLEYWLDDTWEVNQVSSAALDEREGYLYDEANRYLSWFFGQ